MEYYKDDFTGFPSPPKKLRVLIIGAGICGLTAAIGLAQAGHHVIVFEQASRIAKVGAGIQLSPNNTRILGRLGILPDVLAHTNLLEGISLRTYDTNEQLGYLPVLETVASRYHAPIGVIHRGDLQEVMLTALQKAGAELRTGARVARCDPDFAARIELAGSGEWIDGDIVIAADGIKSTLRAQIARAHNHSNRIVPTGDAAYRILVPRARLAHDERALELLDRNVAMRWVGPGGHIMAYPIQNGETYNIVMAHPAKEQMVGEETNWTSKGDKHEMLARYADWNDVVKDLLSWAPEGEVLEWALNSLEHLPKWYENKVVLMGDACHPMLPYVAQGAAQAMEDAAVLTACLSKTSNVTLAAAVYELVRKKRGEAIQDSALAQSKTLHLPPGPEQQARDEKIRQAMNNKKTDERSENPDRWIDTEWQDFMWKTDVMRDTLDKWDEYVAKIEGHDLNHTKASS